MTIGDRIRVCRTQVGLSVSDLAKRLGKSRATVYRYENGDIENLPIGIISDLAAALETSPNYLMGVPEDNGKAPDPITEDQRSEIQEIFDSLEPANQTKLLELAHLFLASQHRSEENG